CWHFIGHLQSNKTRLVAEYFDWVHSIDRLKIAERLSQQRATGRPPLNVCLQVNIDDESSKAGIAAGDAPELAAAVAALPNLTLRGLMCIPAMREDFEEQRKPFARLRELRDALEHGGMKLDTLSMGMSNDFRAAIFEGATLVRIGTAVFGPRT
ncbi:MAG: YggS family pyridoxal phosphate-dependent enzyme, partial [Woeseiaceae bacterium]|nr:YggS family pyridoxal phosphate-dependent enzyme [Woeseiaceae bacterium]